MSKQSKYVVAALFVVSVAASAVAQQSSASSSERLVQMPPCRLLDTGVTAATSRAEESVRQLDISSTRCGHFVPPVATAYSIRVTVYDHGRDEKLPPQAIAAQPALIRHPVGAPITFPVSSGTHIAVDVEGYYVPPGTALEPISPGSGAAAEPSSGTVTASQVKPALRPHAELYGGSTGNLDVDVNDSYFNVSGFIGSATSASRPWVVLKTGASGGSGGFAVYSSNNTELFKLDSAAALTSFSTSVLSANTDYRLSPAVRGSVVHNVAITNPRDQNGAAVLPVTFFNARSDDEAGSPSTTKFRAFTLAQNLPAGNIPHINFDSQFQYHYSNNTELYHFRSFSGVDNKATFWVKSGNDPLGHGAADMYVSGKVGIGTDNTAPTTYLHISGANVNNRGQLSIAAPDYAQISFYGNSTYGGQAYYDVSGNIMNFGGTNTGSQVAFRTGTAAERLRIDASGNVGIGTTSVATGARLDVQGGNLNVGGSVIATGSVTTSGNVATSGNLSATGNGTTTGNISANGSITAIGSITGGTVHATYQDVAEWVPAAEAMAAGTVVVIGEDGDNTVIASSRAYDTSVAGVVSPNPGLLLGVASASKAKIATTGRVRVRVDATKSPIRKGDLLVTSDRPGMAMKSEPLDINGRKFHQPGTLIGKALEPLESGEGEILVLLSLQ